MTTYTLYRPLVKLAKEATKTFNIAGGHPSLQDNECPYIRLIALKAATPFLSADSANLSKIISATQEVIQSGVMKPVIKVKADSLNQVFELTNVCKGDWEKHWTENAEVEFQADEEMDAYLLTSGSIGDLITDENGSAWYIAADGFFEVNINI